MQCKEFVGIVYVTRKLWLHFYHYIIYSGGFQAVFLCTKSVFLYFLFSFVHAVKFYVEVFDSASIYVILSASLLIKTIDRTCLLSLLKLFIKPIYPINRR